MDTIDVLVPTINRLPSLVTTLSGLAGQTWQKLRIIVADQSHEPVSNSPVFQMLRRVIISRGGCVEYYFRKKKNGIAEQRDFLLKQAQAPSVLYLDDDIYLEPWVLNQLHVTLRKEGCGFVGAFPSGLSFYDDIRPEQQKVEFWNGPVVPEAIAPHMSQWERWHLHRAANVFHAGQKIPKGEIRRYKVAWIGACVLYDREKLLKVGGFSFWSKLPRFHSGEDVLVQNLLMRRWGGCGILPSGTYTTEFPSTVLNAKGTVDGHALDLLPQMIQHYVPEAI